MVKLILITEICDDGINSGAYDYDLLPTNVKKVVDNALKSNIRNIYIDMYEDGLQYLYDINHPEIKIGENVQYIGSVELYHNDN